MKTLSLIVLLAAGVALGLVALRAPEREYVPPTLAEVQTHVPAPTALPAEVPVGCTLRTLDVEGMCCTGCTGKLYARLKTVPGVVAGAVDFEAGTAQAYVAAGADAAALATALSFDKYRATLR